MQGKAMTSGTPWKHILRFALPVLLGSLLQQLYNTVDTIIVGNFTGEDALSAVGTTGTLTFFFLAIATGLSAGSGVVIAQHFGAGDEANVRRNASAGIVFVLLAGAVSAVIGILFSHPAFVYLIAVPSEILHMTEQYFVIYSVGLLFQFGYNIFSSILRAVGDSRATLYFLLISSVTNVLLDLLFVAVFRWGVAGAAAATVIAQFLSFAAAYCYMISRYPVFRFRLKEYRWNTAAVKRIIQIGMPISLQLVIVSIGLTFIQRAVNEFGKVMTASYTVGTRLEQYINLPFNALQTTLATYTGQNVGAGRYDRVKQGARQGTIISIGFTVCISACIWYFARQIAGIFGIGAEAMVFCIQHLRTVAFIGLLLACYVPLFGVFQGSGHSGFPAVVATCVLSTRVALVYIFRYSSFLGYRILWWNGLFGFSLGVIIAWSYYLSGKWLSGIEFQRR